MKNVVIVDGLRTPFGRLGGGLRQFHNVEMGGMVIKGLLEKTQLDVKNYTHTEDDYMKWAIILLILVVFEVVSRYTVLRHIP